jgi:hypothetical protein
MHEGLPDVGFEYPGPYLDVPEDERAERTTYTTDRCTVRDADGDEHYFVRGVIFLPVRDGDRAFGIGAWVSQSRANFERYAADEAMEPTFGWLVNRIERYPDTFLLKTRVHFREGNHRPSIELEPTEHPLAVEQRTGITLARAWEMVHPYMEN